VTGIPGGTTPQAVVQPSIFPPTRPRDFGAPTMAKPHRGLKKANHGARPANSKARKAKRRHIRT